MGNGIMRVGEVGGRQISKSARIEPLEIRSETGIVAC